MSNAKKEIKTLRLILGDQLNHQHSWFNFVNSHTTYVLMELRQETDYAWHHIQKVVGFFVAMQNFAKELAKKNHQVIYISLNDALILIFV
jgi:deoxyribodipyrimidine photolyase-related protein